MDVNSIPQLPPPQRKTSNERRTTIPSIPRPLPLGCPQTDGGDLRLTEQEGLLKKPGTSRDFPPIPDTLNFETVQAWTRQVFGFELDPFQITAIQALFEDKSVIVSAPTGAGKTVVAEALVYSRLSAGGGVVYTSPIKALSNQKYRDFCEAIGPERVGLVTGDVVINDTAPFRIMTTEVYRNILLEGQDRLEGIRHIIFDEIHYLDDAERGTVWEESLILTSPSTRLLALSATIPNLEEFTSWIRTLREEPVELVLETERPVVLHEHFLVDHQWLGDRTLLKQVYNAEIPPGTKPIRNFYQHLHMGGFMPLIYFVFSRNRAWQYAEDAAKSWNFLKSHERDQVSRKLEEMIAERELTNEPVLERLTWMLERGVAYHHAGLRPVYKEIVERLYSTGLIKMLFATETFSVGVNMPARSVVFDSLAKYDGKRVRPLTYREAQQMSGRAGRRGMDDEGNAFYQVNTRLEELENVLAIFDSGHDRMSSQFSLSYNSLLNLFGRYGRGLYEFSKKSFGAFQLSLEKGGMTELKHDLGVSVERLMHARCFKKPKKGIYVDFFKWKRRVTRLESNMQEATYRKNQSRGYKREQLANDIHHMRERTARYKANMQKAICFQCPKEEVCQRVLEDLDKAQSNLEHLSKREASITHQIADEIELRLRYLEHLGYIRDEELLPRGEFAAGVFGYELLITEVYFEGLLFTLTETEINCLFAALCFEARKDTRFTGHAPKNLKSMFQEVDAMRNSLNREARNFDLPAQAGEMDGRIAPSMIAWCEGATFEDLRSFTTLDDGDIIRTFRIVADLLRQLVKSIKEPDMKQRIQHAMDMIYRDEVDARRAFNL